MTKVSDRIIQILAEWGVTHVFTLPGGFSMHLNDSLNYSKLTPVFCLHESGAAFSAIGYAKYTDGIGVCLVTSGPGATNTLTAVTSAWQDNVPLIVISGDGKRSNLAMRKAFQLRQGGQQDVDIMHMVAKITKYHAMLSASSLTDSMMANALRYATQGRRGPAWVSVPLDVQAEQI